MRTLDEKEIDFIFNDIKARGVTIEDLQLNLLDHICCIMEEELSYDQDFYKFYENVLPRFFKNELREIEEETTNLLTFKNYYAMKNTLYISGIATAFFTVAGAILKSFHLPGAGVCIVLAGFFFSLVFLPLMIVLKFKDEESKTDKLVFAFGFILASIAAIGVIFKIMHWPTAMPLMLSSVTLYVFAYVPIYFLTRIRRVEMRFNTMVNSVIMISCGGLLFAMFNLSNSKDIRDSFYVMHESMRQQTIQSNEESAQVMMALPDSVKRSMEPVYKRTKELLDYMEAFRIHSIVLSQSVSEEEAVSMNIQDMAWGTGTEHLQHELLDEQKTYNAIALKRMIGEWKAGMTEIGVDDSELARWVNLDEMATKEYGNQSWEDAHFKHATVVSLITYLDQLSVEVNQRFVQVAFALNKPDKAV
jgi:hypothetical protein